MDLSEIQIRLDVVFRHDTNYSTHVPCSIRVVNFGLGLSGFVRVIPWAHGIPGRGGHDRRASAHFASTGAAGLKRHRSPRPEQRKSGKNQSELAGDGRHTTNRTFMENPLFFHVQCAEETVFVDVLFDQQD